MKRADTALDAPDPTQQLDPLLTPRQVAKHRHTTEGFLAQERYRGTGPKFVKSGRRVLYKVSDLNAYIDAQTMQRTDDRPGVA